MGCVGSGATSSKIKVSSWQPHGTLLSLNEHKCMQAFDVLSSLKPNKDIF